MDLLAATSCFVKAPSVELPPMSTPVSCFTAKRIASCNSGLKMSAASIGHVVCSPPMLRNRFMTPSFLVCCALDVCRRQTASTTESCSVKAIASIGANEACSTRTRRQRRKMDAAPFMPHLRSNVPSNVRMGKDLRYRARVYGP